ncbi:MAG: epimerase [Pseudomonadota bacterium]
MTQTALILGARGRIGRNAAAAFQAAGWQVAAFNRATGDLAAAMHGAEVVVNAWNPPDYATWHRDLPRIHRSVIDAARRHDTPVIVPGNVYVFGADVPAPWSEASPHGATNPLGRLRIEMEAAYRASGVRTILLRGGDFLDTAASGNWFDRVIAKPLPKGRISYPGPVDVPHAWAYLPDMARAVVALAGMRDDLPRYVDIPFPGYTLTGNDIAEALSDVLHRPVRAARMPWWPLRVAAPVWPMLRGLLEMRYLWDTPHALDGALFDSLLPGFRHTPVEDALARAAAHVATFEPRGATVAS